MSNELYNYPEDQAETFYTHLLDLCVLWGREHLMHGETEELHNVENEFLAALSQINGQQELSDGLAGLEKAVNFALDTLSSETTIVFDPGLYSTAFTASPSISDDEEITVEEKACCEIECALLTLDSMVYLLDAVCNFARLTAMNNGLREKVRLLYERAIVERRPPGWRLIPLNSLRQTRLAQIPPDDRYLFPWYEDWHEVIPQALRVFAESLAGQEVNEEELSPANLRALQADIGRDAPLMQRIMGEVILIRELPKAMEGAYALRWFHALSEEAAAGVMPETVARVGGINATLLVLARDILAQKKGEEWRFRAAACGIGLTRDERLTLLEETEKLLKTNALARMEGESLATLRLWHAGFLNDGELARKLYTGWRKDIQEVAEQGLILKYSKEFLMALLKAQNPTLIARNIYLRAAAELAAFWNAAEMFLHGIFKARRLLSFGPEDTAPEPCEKDMSELLPMNPLPLPLPDPVPGTGYQLLAGEAGTEKLIDVLFESEFFWCAQTIDNSGQIRALPVIGRRGLVPVNVPGDDLQAIILGVAGNREILEKIFASNEISSTSPSESSAVALIVYMKNGLNGHTRTTEEANDH